MALNVGSRLGHYQVTALIGEGGMGQVYPATDTKLNRQVALKILPEAFAADPDRLARFQREAQVLASLNHPNIAAIHGLEDSGDTKALVLELVEGPTLADRIAQGPIPLDEALPIAKQIAEALEAAHEAGVIHRDLKPANVKVKDDGTVKVLDFGLAKALDTTPQGDPSQSPTLTAAATQMGVIMGTAAYMSPEQARGKVVDKRADIWSFGAVLFEMLTGRRAFAGEDVSLTLSAVLQREPEWDTLPPNVSPGLNTYLRRCLHKDATQRVQAIGDVRLAMEGAFETTAGAPSQQVVPATLPVWLRQRPATLAIAVLAALAVGGVAVWTVTRLAPPAPQLTTRATILLPATDQLAQTPRIRLALSPDGMTLVYRAVRDGVTQLYRRELDQLDAVAIPGTENANSPLFSPNGEWLAFESDRVLKKVALRGGPATTICDLPFGVRGGTWTADDTIIFGGDFGLLQVPGAGGEPRPFLDLEEGESGHAYPVILPGGRAVLFRSTRGTERVVVVHSLETGERRELVDGASSAHYVPTGHLVFGRAGSLWAAPFDLDALDLSGEPIPILEGVVMETAAGVPGPPAQAAFARTGALVYVSGDAGLQRQHTLVWVDRQGQEEPLAAAPRSYVYPRLSPDGTRVALDVRDQDDILLWDLALEMLRPLTSGPSNGQYPVWTPDGRRVAFSSSREGALNLFWKAADGTGEVERLTDSPNLQFPHAFSPDGTRLVYREDHSDTAADLGVLSLEGERPAEPLLATEFSELNAELSPNGRWVAYQSDASGQYDIYVRSFPDVNQMLSQISTDGGTEPLWGHDGRELFYRSDAGLMVVAVETEPSFAPGTQDVVVDDQYYAGLVGRNYDIALDGQRFLFIKGGTGPATDQSGQQINVILNWFEELKRLVPVD